jgi:hypothetical protein
VSIAGAFRRVNQHRQAAEVAGVGASRVGAADDVAGMVHRVKAESVGGCDRSAARIEDRVASRKLAPCHPPHAYDDARMHQLELGEQMRSAIRDLAPARIAIPAARVARVASDQIGNEDPANRRAADHLPEQIAGTIAAEWNSSAIAAEAAGRDPHERDGRRRRAVARHHSRAASHQRGASLASQDRGAQRIERVAPR